MAHIPPQLLLNADPYGLQKHFGLPRRGKVRDIFDIGNGMLLVVTTDRISIFDVVLSDLIAQKGEILNAINIAWTKILSFANQDILAYGSHVDVYLPDGLRGNRELWKRAVVVQRMVVLPFEAVVRGNLTGTGLKDYTSSGGFVCGHRLPDGLMDGDRIIPIFTPSTKSDEHDANISANEVAAIHGPDPERLALQLFTAAVRYAEERGFIIADTKFEFARNAKGELVVVDERLTPDSSRFWPYDAWLASRQQGKAPVGPDKQFVRTWGPTVGIKSGIPITDEYLAHVAAQKLPADIVEGTRSRYRQVFATLFGRRIEVYQHEEMGIPMEPVRIKIIVGSKNDLPQIEGGIELLQRLKASGMVKGSVSVLSCHRHNPRLREYLANSVHAGDTIIAAAGEAAQLAAMTATYLRDLGKEGNVFGVALDGKDEEGTEAARLSIKRVPGKPCILDEDGEPYRGPDGFARACHDAIYRELPPKAPRNDPPAQPDFMEI